MSHRTSAEVVLDSTTTHGDATRLTAMYVVFPKMILGERNRHRAFSLSDRSSRAVPPEKLIAEVRDDPAMPAKFRRRTKGMGGGEEMVGDELSEAQERWKAQAYRAAHTAAWAAAAGEAKETANRYLDPYIRMHSLMTSTRDGWLNFFGLRLDEGADPTIQVLAQRCFDAYRASTPRLLRPGEWHLPFVDNETLEEIIQRWVDEQEWPVGTTVDEAKNRIVARFWTAGIRDTAIKVSAARCAHLSYNDLETGKRMTVERALAIYNRLVGSRPIHASPCEHQATPDEWDVVPPDMISLGWRHPEQHGNLVGWIQSRKMLPGEAVAPLPEGYEL
jgi:thymidylate synthase ThyX